jgi:hypothetical protein
MERTDARPDDLIESQPEPVREDMRLLDESISQVMDGLPRDVWAGPFWGGTQQQIIGYGRYTYKGRSGREGEWFIVGLASQKDYLSLYVNGTVDGTPLAKHYAERLGKVKASSGVVTFRRLEVVDLEVLVELVRRARDLSDA